MAGLQGQIHSPIEEGTPQKTVAPSPIESSDGSKSGPSGPAKQHRKAVTAGPAETPRPVSNKRTSSRASTRPPTPLAIQAPIPTFPSPSVVEIEGNIAQQDEIQEIFPGTSAIVPALDGARVPNPKGEELEGNINAGVARRAIIEMAKTTENIAKTKAFGLLNDSLRQATERGTLFDQEGTPTPTQQTFQHQTLPIPSVPPLDELQNESGTTGELLHNMAHAVNTLSQKLDRSLMNEQFFTAQFLIQSNMLFMLRESFNQLEDKVDNEVHRTLLEVAACLLSQENMLKELGENMRKSFNGLAHTTREQFDDTKSKISQNQPANSPPDSQQQKKEKARPTRWRPRVSSSTRSSKSKPQ